MKPREIRQERTRQAILDAARQIINKGGPDALSMRALARRIDYSPAGLYEYFASKDEIVAAVCDEGHGKLTAFMAAVDPGLAPRDYLMALGQAYIRFALAHPDYFALMFSAAYGPRGAPDPTGPVEGEPEDSFHILLRAIARGLEAGTIRARADMDLLGIAYAAWATVHGLAMLRITALSETPEASDAADRATLENFWRGLAC